MNAGEFLIILTKLVCMEYLVACCPWRLLIRWFSKPTHMLNNFSDRREEGRISQSFLQQGCGNPSTGSSGGRKVPPPPVRRNKWPKSSIFGKFLVFCPLRITFCPLDAPTKKILVPPLTGRTCMHSSVYCCTWVWCDCRHMPCIGGQPCG